MKRYEVVFVFDSEKQNKWDALTEWYKKDNYLKDTQDFIGVELIDDLDELDRHKEACNDAWANEPINQSESDMYE